MKSSKKIQELFQKKGLNLEIDLADYYIKNPRIDLFVLDEIPEFTCNMIERSRRDDNKSHLLCSECLISKIYEKGGIILEDCDYCKCETVLTSLITSLIRERALFDELYESGFFTNNTFFLNLPKDKDGNLLDDMDMIDEIVNLVNSKAEEIYSLSFQDFPLTDEKIKILSGDNKFLAIYYDDKIIRQSGFELLLFILWRNKLIDVKLKK